MASTASGTRSSSAKPSDWLEWQASYAASALLAPATQVRNVVRPIVEAAGAFGPVDNNSETGGKLIAAVASGFTISTIAARVRLNVLGVLGTPRAEGSLFDR